MRRLVHRVSWLIGLVLLVELAVIGRTQTPDPIVGTWKLNPGMSTYSPGPPPKSMTVRITPAGKGYMVAIDAVGADGQPQTWSYTTTLDGQESPVMGNPAFDAVSSTGTGAGGTVTYRKAGKVVSTLTSAVSADGKTLTVKTKSTDPQGREMTAVAVYDRQ